MLCATKLGSRKLPAENMVMADRHFSIFTAKENGEVVARETVLGGRGGSGRGSGNVGMGESEHTRVIVI